MSQTNNNAAKTILRFVLAATVITCAPDIAANIRIRLMDDPSTVAARAGIESHQRVPDELPQPEPLELIREQLAQTD